MINPPDNPLTINGVPVYIIPTLEVDGRLTINNREWWGEQYLDDMWRALNASALPIFGTYETTIRQILDLAQGSFATGSDIYQCAVGEVEIVLTKSVINFSPWYYVTWEKMIHPDSRPVLTAEQREKRAADRTQANREREQKKRMQTVEVALWDLWRRHRKNPAFFEQDLFMLGQLAFNDVLADWLYRHATRAEFDRLLTKVRIADMTATQLKQACRTNDLPTSGKKGDLIQRLWALPQSTQRAAIQAA